MDMLRSLKNFLYNHRHKFILSGIAVGGAVAAYNYLSYHRKESFEANEFLQTIRRQKHFESLENVCFHAMCDSGISTKEEILHSLSIDSIVAYLKTVNDSEKWEELTSNIIVELCIMIYAEALVVLISKTQYSIIGGYLYKNVGQQDKQLNYTSQYQYLSLCKNFSKFGLPLLTETFKTELNDISKSINNKFIQPCSMDDLREIMTSVQNLSFNLDIIRNIPIYLGMNQEIELTTDPVLKKILDETADLLTNEKLVLPCWLSLINSGFTHVTNQLSVAYDQYTERLTSKRTILFVNALPLIHNTIKTMKIHTWMIDFLKCDKLKIFATNVYESFS